MGPLFAKSGLKFECELVDTASCWQLTCGVGSIYFDTLAFLAKVRDWCRLMPSGATLKNCYRARKGDRDNEDALKVPHSFTFIQRQGRGSGQQMKHNSNR